MLLPNPPPLLRLGRYRRRKLPDRAKSKNGTRTRSAVFTKTKNSQPPRSLDFRIARLKVKEVPGFKLQRKKRSLQRMVRADIIKKYVEESYTLKMLAKEYKIGIHDAKRIIAKAKVHNTRHPRKLSLRYAALDSLAVGETIVFEPDNPISSTSIKSAGFTRRITLAVQKLSDNTFSVTRVS